MTIRGFFWNFPIAQQTYNHFMVWKPTYSFPCFYAKRISNYKIINKNGLVYCAIVQYNLAVNNIHGI
jgi:hypothetical protein